MYNFPLGSAEIILKKDLASMSVGDDAYNGALYLTNERLVFVGYVMDIRNKYIEEIAFHQIAELKSANSLFIVPNAISLTTMNGRTRRFVVKDRTSWIAEIRKKIDELASY